VSPTRRQVRRDSIFSGRSVLVGSFYGHTLAREPKRRSAFPLFVLYTRTNAINYYHILPLPLRSRRLVCRRNSIEIIAGGTTTIWTHAYFDLFYRRLVDYFRCRARARRYSKKRNYHDERAIPSVHGADVRVIMNPVYLLRVARRKCKYWRHSTSNYSSTARLKTKTKKPYK